MISEKYRAVILQAALGQQIELDSETKEAESITPYIQQFYRQHKAQIEAVAETAKAELSYRSGEHGASHYMNVFVQNFPMALKAELIKDPNSPGYRFMSLDVIVGVLAFETIPYKCHMEELDRIRQLELDQVFPKCDD